MADLTQARLKELLHYDPETGVFTWLVNLQGRYGRAGTVAGCQHRQYIKINVDAVRYYAHDLAWLYVQGEWPLLRLDHRDGVGTHNWIENLRPATQSQNIANSKLSKANSCGLKGVQWRKDRSRWRSHITVSGKRIYLGMFTTKEEAHAAYCVAAVKHFGEFARFK